MALEDLFARRPQPGPVLPKTPPVSPNVPAPSVSSVAGHCTTFGYRVDKLKADVRDFEKQVNKREGERDLLLKQLDDEIIKQAEAERFLAVFDKVQTLLQKTSDYARQQAKARMEEIVTTALTVIFGQGYKFWIELTTRSNRPEADYWLERDGIKTQLQPPDYDRGGGVADVVSLALRLAVAELDKVQGPFFLDEVGKHVSREYAPNVAYFLKEYSQRFNRQIILITHNDALAEVGEVSIGVSQRGGRSEVKTL